MTASPKSHAHRFRNLRSTLYAALAGILAAATVLAAAELAGAFFTARARPLIALGSTFIDFTPLWLKNFAVETFGTNDKAALFAGMALTIAVLAACAGVLARRRWGLGVAAVVVMGAVMVACVLTRAGASPVDAGPTVLGTAVGILVLRGLIRRIPATGAMPTVAVETPQENSGNPAAGSSAAPPAEVSAGDGRNDGGAGAGIGSPSPAPRRSPAPSRRGFFAAAGLTALAATAAAAGGRAIASARNTTASFRAALMLPTAATPPPALPSGLQSPVSGVTPWLTPNADFYRIDTALSVPEIDAETWELRIHGLVEQEVRINFAELLDSDLVERHLTLTCVSNPLGGDLAGTAKWLGLPVRELLARARPTADADMVLSTSIDGFSASTPLEVLQDDRDALLAVGMNGEPLPPVHGYPVRMVVPGLYGFVSATKWIIDMEVTRFDAQTAYWTDRGWAEKAPVKTMARVEVPASFARVPAGPVDVGGTAWSQQRGITGVEISIDDGDWQPALLAAEASVDTWRQFSFRTEALSSGNHTVRARAADPQDGVQTDARADTVPDGASGWQSVQFMVE
ncbi:molybdopterin-dependent oxidoreductase [Arthrobacter gengyunqii]|uniref:Molybdopterin-dependent oxidoreductase n=1 Tax=Arthrobacter gengyunqii TaxID=2886940 RepID=A0A9X1M024_9MICC|nr:molybdopterin-dependent oxidoreductase [Arthrobacter gengyunqii]MCC3268445.1 molybdopterin-dependent oxidoreductase [Arthrobacter gengyunqii]UOY95838.1 molybdopterin-dependent oxidoreductase [Arthrobacter gengyunqii]